MGVAVEIVFIYLNFKFLSNSFHKSTFGLAAVILDFTLPLTSYNICNNNLGLLNIKNNKLAVDTKLIFCQ